MAHRAGKSFRALERAHHQATKYAADDGERYRDAVRHLTPDDVQGQTDPIPQYRGPDVVVSVRAVARPNPDLNQLARVLLEIADEQREADHDADEDLAA